MNNAYITLDEFTNMLGLESRDLDSFAEECIGSASRDIDAHCGRRFYTEIAASGSPTAREFMSLGPYRVWIDDCWEAPTVVATDDGDAGTFSTTWSSSDYTLEPRNGIGPTAQTGWPYTSICAVSGRTFPVIVRPTNVRVTARWGWAQVPSAVKTACRRLAQSYFEARNAPFGVAGMGDTGTVIRIRTDQMTLKLLEPFVRRPVLVG